MIKKNELIYTLNKEEYLLVNIPSKVLRVKGERIKKWGGIIQGVKEVKMEGLFSGGYVLVNLLIPTRNIEEFNKIAFED